MFEINENDRWYLVKPEGEGEEGVWIEYRIPSATDTAEYIQELRRIKRDAGIEDNDAGRVFELGDTINQMVKFASKFIVSSKGITFNKEEIVWTDNWLESKGTSFKNVLTNLGKNPQQKLNNLIYLVSQMRIGMLEDTKKKQNDTSESE